MTEPEHEPRHRLFFALWPDDASRQRIVDATADHVRAAGGRPTPRENLHVTVEFIGSVAGPRLAHLEEAGAQLASPPFDLVLARVEHWRRQRILSLEPEDSPPALDALVAKLRQALAARGFVPESRPFRAHLTLARDARPPRDVAPGIDPVVWSVRELSLIESVTAPQGSRYTRLQSWLLAREYPPRDAGFAPVTPGIP